VDQACVELAIEESLKEAENGPPGVIPPQTVIEQTKKPQSNIDDLLNLGMFVSLYNSLPMTHNNDETI